MLIGAQCSQECVGKIGALFQGDTACAAIGVAAGYGAYLGAKAAPEDSFEAFYAHFSAVRDALAASRPTAVNLFWALRRMDYYVGVSDAMREMLIERGFDANRIFPIYNGVEFSAHSEQAPDDDRRALLSAMADEVDGGAALPGAMENTGRFPTYVTALVEVGERTGRTDSQDNMACVATRGGICDSLLTVYVFGNVCYQRANNTQERSNLSIL